MDDYKAILKLVTAESPKDEVYSELMQKEDKTLNVVNRIVNQDGAMKREQTLFENMSILDIIATFANNLKNMFTEVFIEHQVTQVLSKKDRKLFFGMFLVLIALFLILLNATS